MHQRFLPTVTQVADGYLSMGYTTCFEPAILPCNARAAHLEMSAIPNLTTGGYCLLGNEPWLLDAIAQNVPQERINAYVAWMVAATGSIAVKVVNAGGIDAFKFARRSLDVDQPHPKHGVTPSQVIRVLARAVNEIGLRHPLHVHASNLGVPGNIDSTMATIEAADGYPLHLAHVQFHSYGLTESDGNMCSAAGRIVDAMNRHPNLSVDVGAVMFGQTVTISADSMHQFANTPLASPKKSVILDVECQSGCGVVPFRYRKKKFVNALQWAIGLELFLAVEDTSRIFLTTDHPNGGSFRSYPHLMRLLCDRSFRETALAEIDSDAAAASSLAGMTRQYSIDDIARMTRSGPAEVLGLSDRGHLRPGAVADVTVVRRETDVEAAFSKPKFVIRGGRILFQEGRKLEDDRVHASSSSTSPILMAGRQRLAEIGRDRFDVPDPNFAQTWIDDDEFVELMDAKIHPAGMQTADPPPEVGVRTHD